LCYDESFDGPFSTVLKRKIHMPEISRFYGIIVAMFFDDHNPPPDKIEPLK